MQDVEGVLTFVQHVENPLCALCVTHNVCVCTNRCVRASTSEDGGVYACEPRRRSQKRRVDDAAVSVEEPEQQRRKDVKRKVVSACPCL